MFFLNLVQIDLAASSKRIAHRTCSLTRTGQRAQSTKSLNSSCPVLQEKMADATPKRKPLSNISNTIGTMPPPPPRPKMDKVVSVKGGNVDDAEMAGNLEPDHIEQGEHVPTEARELEDANMNGGKPAAEQVNGRSKRKLECLDTIDGVDCLHEQVKVLKRENDKLKCENVELTRKNQENEALRMKIDELEKERRALVDWSNWSKRWFKEMKETLQSFEDDASDSELPTDSD